jgi:hypothetical protein
VSPGYFIRTRERTRIMPTKRMLLTLLDVKKLIAKKYKCEESYVVIFESSTLSMINVNDGPFDVGDNNYIFQVDFEAEI